MYIGLYVKYPLLSDFNAICYILYRLSKNIHMQNFVKIRGMGEDLFHTDGRTERHDEANSTLSKF
jgi:hypothetical protein